MDNKEIKFYTDENGRQPYCEWLKTLDKPLRARIDSRLDRVKDGNYGKFSHLGDGIFELKFDFGSGYRVYFGEDEENIVLLLIGGDKSTQEKDIQAAKYYWKDYTKRKAGV